MRPAIMLIGVGHLGGAILDQLAADPLCGPITACDLASSGARDRCRLARLSALARGVEPDLVFEPLDLRDRPAVIELIERFAPDLILSTASLQTWWLLDLLPEQNRERLARARFGAWLPINFTLSWHLMQAVVEADWHGLCLTAPFPDVVNCMLGRIGLAPAAGIGNIDENVVKVRWLAARELGVPLTDVRVLMVAHHALQKGVFAGAPFEGELPPYFLRVEQGGRDVTAEVGAHELLFSPAALPGGPAWNTFTAGSFAGLLPALFAGERTLTHLPAPGGLAGGYPVTVGEGSIELYPIKGLPQEEAVQMNEDSHRFDGIERIEADGMAVFTEETAGIMREELGYDCDRLIPGEAEARAGELMARFREYAAGLGVTL
jgi:hypothetical protein